MKQFVTALYTYYTAISAVLVFLWIKQKLNKKNAIYICVFGIPIILFAYYQVFDYLDFFNKLGKVLLQ